MTKPVSPRSNALRRIFANLGLLLGGKASAGLLSLVYLVIVARCLGAHDYGVLILLHAYITLVGGVIAFSGWHGLVRYGAAAIEVGDHSRLMHITRFLALLELICGAVAIIAAAALAPVIGPHLGWSPETTRFAIFYSLAILATVRSTPAGLVQVAGRFDLVGAHHMVNPAVRLVGCLIVWAAGGGLIAFLTVWLAAAIAEWASMWALGWWVLRRMKLAEPLIGPVRGAARANAGLLPFIVTTNVDLTLTELAPRLAPLTVGWMLGPTAAGIFSLAQRASTVLQQPALLLGQAGYAVMARLLAAGDFEAFRHAVWHSALTAMLIAVPIVALLALFGEQFLALLGGGSFSGGATLLLLIAIARAIMLGMPSLSSALIAMGRPSASVAVNLVTNLALYPLLPLMLILWGVDGAGWHILVQGLVGAAALAWLFRASMKKLALPPAPAPESA